jgi:hypothetical protein
MAILTAWSRFRFYAGGVFCLMGGFGNSLPYSLQGDIGWIAAGIVYALAAFGFAYAVRGRKKVRNWNAVAQWFFWISLILPGLIYSARIAPK